MAKTPNVLWAQRPHCVYLTIDVQDVKEPKLEITSEDDGKQSRLTFSGTASDSGTEYSLDLQLFAGVDKEQSKFNTLPRHIFLVLEKNEEGSWPRLTKESSKGDKHIKVDWDKWVDSDDDAADDIDMSGMSGMGGMGGGMGGPPGGMDFASMLGGMGGGGLGGGGMGGMGGLPPGMDMEKLMASMGGAAGGPGGEGDSDEDDDDDDLPPLEAAEPQPAAAEEK
ncbi:hypothetical protein MNEG_9489 [Monoraphidium neglectum]|uniref:CS domain-containing protein n=1 Tax=Monoraphidium neglectum TaxID=145388 RepID=A0A0D2M4J5_9CHLO|nr:hypothetical protein MNEG_9489 [Monoraphidium neglectum]KIY98474.1 hypothetical protein MNEG_9489 [Monoraphidium neglectum]|eukprot:XP_013897494.1 hypothetical protein MNEG_9489 [Monoraphidium neglectum]